MLQSGSHFQNELHQSKVKSYDYIFAYTAGHSKKLAPFALKRGQIYECVPYFMRGFMSVEKIFAELHFSFFFYERSSASSRT